MNFNNKKHTSGKSDIQKKSNIDGLKPGDYCRIINQTTNEVSYGKITFENEYLREVQQDTNFKVFSFYNYKFVREYE